MLKFRSLLAQLCAISPHICLQLALGSANGIQVILIAELHKEDSEIPITLEQLSWFASLDIVKLVGSIATGILMHHLGSRVVSLIATSVYITSCLLYYYSSAIATVFASRVLTSLITVSPLAFTYVSEISEPSIRGSFLTILNIADNSGLFFSLLLGSLMYWRTIVLANLIFPLLALVTVLYTPNSPTWLASNGRLDDAKKALCWLRGWVQMNEVQVEFGAMIESVQSSKPTKNEGELDIETINWRTRSRDLIQLFSQRSFCLPFGTMCILFLVFSFSGTETVATYATVIFHEINAPIEESVATAIMGAMAIVGQFIIMLCISRVGKRKLIFFSVTVVGLCYASVAVVGFLKLQDNYLWVSPIAVILANLADSTGTGPIIYMLNSEIFPSSFRYVGTSIGFAVGMITRASINKLFLYIANAFTMSGVFTLFAVVNTIALVTYYFLFPETEGKSLKDIEDHYKGVKSINENAKS